MYAALKFSIPSGMWNSKWGVAQKFDAKYIIKYKEVIEGGVETRSGRVES